MGSSLLVARRCCEPASRRWIIGALGRPTSSLPAEFVAEAAASTTLAVERSEVVSSLQLAWRWSSRRQKSGRAVRVCPANVLPSSVVIIVCCCTSSGCIHAAIQSSEIAAQKPAMHISCGLVGSALQQSENTEQRSSGLYHVIIFFVGEQVPTGSTSSG